MPFSLDPTYYEPMCKSCHRKHDLQKDPHLRARAVARGKDLAALAQARWSEKYTGDPQFRKRADDHARGMATPESRAAGGRAAAERRREDPGKDFAYREARRVTGLATSTLRRVCSCGLVSNPGAIGRHQKATGHSSPR